MGWPPLRLEVRLHAAAEVHDQGGGGLRQHDELAADGEVLLRAPGLVALAHGLVRDLLGPRRVTYWEHDGASAPLHTSPLLLDSNTSRSY